MINTISHWFHVIAELIYYINPVMMGFATVMWFILYNRTSNDLQRTRMKCYVIQKQIDYMVSQQMVEPEFINCMKRMGEDYE